MATPQSDALAFFGATGDLAFKQIFSALQRLIEGLDHREDCNEVAELACRDGRDNVGCIILGRGSDEKKVVEWLRNAAGVPSFIGFAVGRTSFWDALVALRNGKHSRQQAVGDIAGRYLEWARVFEQQNAN